MRTFLAAVLLLAPVAAALRAPAVGRMRISMVHGPDHSALKGVTRKLPMLTPLTAVPAAAVLFSALPAFAKGGEFGLLEKKLPALIHPVVMGTMFVVSLGAAYTGSQWRRLREVGQSILTLKAELKPIAETLERTSTQNATKIELEGKIAALTATRTSLASQNLRDTHWAMGSVLLGIGTSFAIEGPVNTYMRTGKLFPGPHLYAGAGCIALWSLAAALTPQMQKGNDAARTGHIAFNTLGLGLFAWQLPTGFEILTNVWNKVPWV